MAISSTLFYQVISAILTAVLAFAAIVQTYNSLKYGIYARMEPKTDIKGGLWMTLILGNTGPGLVEDISWKLDAYSPAETGFDLIYNDGGKVAFIPPQSTVEVSSGLPRFITSFDSKLNKGNPSYMEDFEEYRSFSLTIDNVRFHSIVITSNFKFNADGSLSRYKREWKIKNKSINERMQAIRKRMKKTKQKKKK